MVSVMTCDGRCIVGRLRGFDQTTNIVLDRCVERVFSEDAAVEEVPLGLYVVRGDNVAMVGLVDAELDEQGDLGALRGKALKPLTH